MAATIVKGKIIAIKIIIRVRDIPWGGRSSWKK